MLIKIKSITPVLANNEWRIRGRFLTDDPIHLREVFYGIGAGYTMHQAQLFADSLARDINRHGENS